MDVGFEKWQAAGNDFLIVWNDKQDNYLATALRNQAQHLCQRSGRGVGADGI